MHIRHLGLGACLHYFACFYLIIQVSKQQARVTYTAARGVIFMTSFRLLICMREMHMIKMPKIGF